MCRGGEIKHGPGRAPQKACYQQRPLAATYPLFGQGLVRHLFYKRARLVHQQIVKAGVPLPAGSRLLVVVVLGCAYLLFGSLPTRSLSLNTVSKLLPLI